MVRKLSLWNPISDADEAAVLALPFIVRDMDAGQYIVWERDTPHYTCLLLSGFAYRHKEAGNGGRQIMSIHMRGDILDLQNSLLGTADHNVQMLSAGQVALVPVEAVREVAFSHPNVGMAMWYETLVEGSIFREWILNIGRRNASNAHRSPFVRICTAARASGNGSQTEYVLPITQDQLADAVSLTSVHVNRTLMKLEADGRINRTNAPSQSVTGKPWQSLQISIPITCTSTGPNKPKLGLSA